MLAIGLYDVAALHEALDRHIAGSRLKKPWHQSPDHRPLADAQARDGSTKRRSQPAELLRAETLAFPPGDVNSVLRNPADCRRSRSRACRKAGLPE